MLIVKGTNKRGRVEFRTACLSERGARELTDVMKQYGITVTTRRATAREHEKWSAYLDAVGAQRPEPR